MSSSEPESAMHVAKKLKIDTSQEMLASGSKTVGEEEVKVRELYVRPKDYVRKIYTDRMSGDVLLLGPPPDRKIHDYMDGMFLIVDSRLFERNVLWSMIYSGMDAEPYEGAETEDKVVIDLIEMNSVGCLPPPTDQMLSKYLNKYFDLLFPVLENQLVAPETIQKYRERRDDAISYLLSINREGADYFMGSKAKYRNREGSVVCAHYKNGRSKAPILIYLACGLEIKKY